MNERLSENQLSELAKALHQGASQASVALAAWLQTESLVEVDSVEQVPFDEALSVIGSSSEVSCFTSLQITGAIQGMLILGFDDQSGLSLCDLILERALGTAVAWSEVEESSALETMNIIGSAYLNRLAQYFSSDATGELEILPSPPTFRRDYAESFLQSAMVGQAMTSNWVFVAKTRFHIRGEQLDWTLLFVPDGESMQTLSSWTV